MVAERWGSEGGVGRLGAIVLVVVGLAASGCTSDAAVAPADPGVAVESVEVEPTSEPTTSAPITTAEPAVVPETEPVLVTRCLVTGPGLVLPESWIAADVSSSGDDCLFILQAEGQADTTVIAGEMFLSSAGRSFDEFVSQVEQGLALGQEPDILGLQLLNTGASGRDLPVLERIELADPNRAVILIHESDRRDGFTALSAVIDVPSETDSNGTHAIQLWGVLGPSNLDPHESPNFQLVLDLINSMQIEPQ